MKWKLTVVDGLQVKLFKSVLFVKRSSFETSKNSSYLHTLICGSGESRKERDTLLCGLLSLQVSRSWIAITLFTDKQYLITMI